VVDKFLGSTSMDYLGWIPYDQCIPRAVRKQKTVLALYPDSPASKKIVTIAKKLAESMDHLDFEGDIKFFWQRLLNH